MALINNEKLYEEIEKKLELVKGVRDKSVIMDPFIKDFSYRFCWSSNALEGNTLSLDETISLIDYDEVRSGHTYTEYQEAKNLYKAIEKQMIPLKKREITEAWIQEANGEVIETDGNYRTGPVYVGNLVEAVYYPPSEEKVPELMKSFFKSVNFEGNSVKEILEKTALTHIQFERIHPFKDGNGRVGRMILNQQLINNGLFPVTFSAKGKYRQAFRIYDKNKDISSVVHILGKAQIEALDRIDELTRNLNKSLQLNQEEQFEW